MPATVRYDVADSGVARIELDRPETRNALSDAVLDDLLAALGDARDDDAVRCVVIASTHPTTFSAGGDLAGFARPRRSCSSTAGSTASRGCSGCSGSWASRRSARRAGTSSRARWGSRSPATSIVASEDATFGTPEIHVGLFPFMVSALAYRNLPRKKVNELLLLGERIDAAEALADRAREQGRARRRARRGRRRLGEPRWRRSRRSC